VDQPKSVRPEKPMFMNAAPPCAAACAWPIATGLAAVSTFS
jgi:hypothetical protein